jgi:AcrR family transcriptional regulator
LKSGNLAFRDGVASKGSADAWLAAGYELLVESGVDAVRINPLAKKVKLSRTSFYWFFRDRQALLSAILDLWRSKNTGNLVGRTRAYAESISESIFNVFDCWLDTRIFDSRLEFAIRSWAQQSPAVAAEIDSADTERIEALTAMFVRFKFSQSSADVRARTIYLTQIGYISMQTVEDLATRMKRIPEYVQIFTGVAASTPELARFHSRHGYVPSESGDSRPMRRGTSRRA